MVYSLSLWKCYKVIEKSGSKRAAHCPLIVAASIMNIYGYFGNHFRYSILEKASSVGRAAVSGVPGVIAEAKKATAPWRCSLLSKLRS